MSLLIPRLLVLFILFKKEHQTSSQHYRLIFDLLLSNLTWNFLTLMNWWMIWLLGHSPSVLPFTFIPKLFVGFWKRGWWSYPLYLPPDFTDSPSSLASPPATSFELSRRDWNLGHNGFYFLLSQTLIFTVTSRAWLVLPRCTCLLSVPPALWEGFTVYTRCAASSWDISQAGMLTPASSLSLCSSLTTKVTL